MTKIITLFLFALKIALDIRPTTGGQLPKAGYLAALAYLVNWKNEREIYFACMYNNKQG